MLAWNISGCFVTGGADLTPFSGHRARMLLLERKFNLPFLCMVAD